MPNGAPRLPAPRLAKAGGGAHIGAFAPRIGPLISGFTAVGDGGAGGGPPGRPPPPPRCGTSALMNVLRSSNTPSLFASRSIVMLLSAGELTKRSPFGAYTISRGAGVSAYRLTVNPAG